MPYVILTFKSFSEFSCSNNIIIFAVNAGYNDIQALDHLAGLLEPLLSFFTALTVSVVIDVTLDKWVHITTVTLRDCLTHISLTLVFAVLCNADAVTSLVSVSTSLLWNWYRNCLEWRKEYIIRVLPPIPHDLQSCHVEFISKCIQLLLQFISLPQDNQKVFLVELRWLLGEVVCFTVSQLRINKVCKVLCFSVWQLTVRVPKNQLLHYVK